MTEQQQMVYVSDSNHDCMPVTLPVDQIKANTYPFVINAPEGLTNPKFDWPKGKWIEQDVTAQAKQLADLKDEVANLQQQTEANVTATSSTDQQLGQIVSMLTAMATPKTTEKGEQTDEQ